MQNPIELIDKAIELTDIAIKKAKGKPVISFTADESKGEGKATALELRYTTALKQLYKPLYDIIKNFDDKKLTNEDILKEFNDTVDKQIKASEKLVEDHIPNIWEEKRKVGQQKREDLGLEKVKQTESPDVRKALIQWQKMNIRQDLEIFRFKVLNKVYGKNYFVTAYAKL